MGTMPILPLIFNMALPMMVSMMVLALYNVVDSIFVSMVSENAFTAVSLAFPLQNLMIAVGAGTGTGINALAAKALGQRDTAHAQQAAMNGIFLALLSYLSFLAIAIFGVVPFFQSQTDVAEILSSGTEYAFIVCAFSFGCFFSITLERILQASGRTIYTMYIQLLGAAMNLILDPILIFGLFGIPAMGAAGAAIATVAGQIGGCCLALYLALRHNPEIPLRFAGFRPEGHVIAGIYKIGFPSIIMQAIGSVMVYGLNLILIGFTTTASAVLGAYFKLQSFVFMPVFGLCNALVPITAFNYGAKNKERMLQTFRCGWGMAASILGVGFLVFELAPQMLLGFFNPTPELLSMGKVAFRIVAMSFFPASFVIVAGSLFQGIGRSVYSMYTSVTRQLAVLLPAAYLLSLTGKLNLVWWAFPIADVSAVLLTAICLKLSYAHIMDELD